MRDVKKIGFVLLVCFGLGFANPSFTDSRDGKKYKTVKIGEQVWMAENLNFKIKDSWCYDNKTSNCKKYGRLYFPETAKKACPAGWRLPSVQEYEILFENVGGRLNAGRTLKAKSGWNKNVEGSDDFAFSALPAGTFVYDGEGFGGKGKYTGFLSYLGDGTYAMSITNDDPWISYESAVDFVDGYSVRCIKGKEEFIDSRDGEKYKIVTIGTQTWMAENLNYETDDSWCYDDEASNRNKYGCLYELYNKNKKELVDICPEGWRLPTSDDFEELIKTVGGKKIAGKKLKSERGWKEQGKGVDEVGFAAYPAGFRSCLGLGLVHSEGALTSFWSSTDGAETWLGLRLNEENTHAEIDDVFSCGSSVRCIKKEYEANNESVGECNSMETLVVVKSNEAEFNEQYENYDFICSDCGQYRSSADIMRVVFTKISDLRRIYRYYLKRNPRLYGKIALKIEVAPSGEVADLSITCSTTNSADFDAKIKMAANLWMFGEGNSLTIPTYSTAIIPFDFTE